MNDQYTLLTNVHHMQVYKYIHAPDHKHNSSDVLDNFYTPETIEGVFVVHDEVDRKYMVFGSPDEYIEYFQATPGPKSYHEVIFGNVPQKLKFDIDASASEVKSPEEFKTILSSVVESVMTAFYIQYTESLEYTDIIFCRSMSPDEPKYSYHLIVNRCVPNSTTARLFTNRVLEYIPDKYKKFLDISVNKHLQNFRLAGCVKSGSKRVKTILSPGYSLKDSFITTMAPLLPEITSCYEEKTVNIHSDDLKAVLKLCSSVTTGHVFRAEHNGTVLFNRVTPSHCDICNRVHQNENSLVITLQYVDGIIKCSYMCRRDQTKAKVYIGEIQSSIGAGITWSAKHLETVLTSTGDTSATSTLFDTLPNKNIFSKTTLDPFPLAETLCVHAGMKMGKTKALLDYINTYFKDNVTTRVVRFISFRQTFSMNIKERFDGFQMYSDIKGDLTQPKLIVQVESLHRLVPGDPVDLVILDECESIFEQFDSGLLRNFNGAFATFQWLLRYAKHVVCMDAYMSDRTYRILARMRPGFETEKTLYYHNTYRNAAGDKCEFTTNKASWLTSLYSSIDAGNRVAIPISSLGEAKAICRTITNKYPDKKVKLYSSETVGSERKDHFSDVNTYWKLYDILIYTPTVSAGVSFEEAHFDKIYGYFVDTSCPVETCIQMIGRIRNVKSRHLVMYLQGTGGKLPTEIQDIKANVYKSREQLFKPADGNLLIYEFGPNGEIKYYDNDYFTIWLENTRIKNISRNSFIKHFVSLITQTGASVNSLQCIPNNNILVDHLEASSVVRGEKVRDILNAPEIDEEDYNNIKLNMLSGDVTAADRNSYLKHKLRADYNFNGELSEKFISVYNKPSTKRIFKNLLRINQTPETDSSLEEIRKYELTNYLSAMENETAQYTDINRRYVYDQHRIAIGMLRACGIDNLNDTKYVNELTLVANLRRAQDYIIGNIDVVYREFGLRNAKLSGLDKLPDGAYIEAMLKIVNCGLWTMYGAYIGRKDKLYKLFPCKLFGHGDDDTKPSVIRTEAIV